MPRAVPADPKRSLCYDNQWSCFAILALLFLVMWCLFSMLLLVEWRKYFRRRRLSMGGQNHLDMRAFAATVAHGFDNAVHVKIRPVKEADLDESGNAAQLAWVERRNILMVLGISCILGAFAWGSNAMYFLINQKSQDAASVFHSLFALFQASNFIAFMAGKILIILHIAGIIKMASKDATTARRSWLSLKSTVWRAFWISSIIMLSFHIATTIFWGEVSDSGIKSRAETDIYKGAVLEGTGFILQAVMLIALSIWLSAITWQLVTVISRASREPSDSRKKSTFKSAMKKHAWNIIASVTILSLSCARIFISAALAFDLIFYYGIRQNSAYNLTTSERMLGTFGYQYTTSNTLAEVICVFIGEPFAGLVGYVAMARRRHGSF